MRHPWTSVILAMLVVAQLQGQGTESETGAKGNQVETKETAVTPAGSALTTIFSPTRAPKRKTMGLLQRSFLDLADQGDQELEIAIVVDGTNSMKDELAGVRRSIYGMLEDLRRYRNNDVRVAIVIYRDGVPPAGAVVIPLKQFTDDEAAITKAVDAIQPESGAPYFHELPDLGLHRALTELPWSNDDQVTKWILMFGDAPPYAEGYHDANVPEAYRRYATSILVSLAKQKNIRINCILCTSSSESYDKAIDETRSFMRELSGGTDGLMLDLSDERIRAELVKASQQPDVKLAKMEPITAIDLESIRRDVVAKAGNVKQVSLAVIPHMPLNNISFDARNPAVRVSTALRNKLAQVPGVRVASPRDIKEQLRRLRGQGITGEQAMRRSLAAQLGVDFVVWGSLVPDTATVQTAAYRKNDGQQVVEIKLANNSSDMAYALIQASAKSAPNDQALSQMLENMQSLQTQLQAPMAANPATNDELLTAMEALEQSLAFEAGDEESVALLETADRASKDAITAEPTNAIAHWLQANVAYNQALRLYHIGDTNAAKSRMLDATASLGEAVKHRNSDQNKKVLTDSLVTEIEADYYLNQRNPEEAVKRYLELTKPDQPLQSQLRGHWMLAGIYAGDWGNAEKPIVDLTKARRHVMEILANWPDSPDAKLLKEWLRWDDTRKQTEFNYLPNLNSGLL